MTDTKSHDSPEDIKRMYWHSRRGMLELDLILVPFAEHQLPQLPTDELQMYRELLHEEDQDLFMWLTRRAPAPAHLQHIVERVLTAHDQARG